MRYLLLDTETCGLKPPPKPASGVVDIAVMEVDEDLNVLGFEYSLINPGCPIDPGASNVHGLYEADVKDAPTLDEWLQIDGEVVLIGHRISFDYNFVKDHLDVKGQLCTLALARRYIRGPENYKLTTLCDFLGIKTGTAHRAAGDLESNLGLLRHVLKFADRPLSDLVEAAGHPEVIHRMTFGKHKGLLLQHLPKGYREWLLEQDIDSNLRYSLDQLKKVGI